jgi:hypothetical protein
MFTPDQIALIKQWYLEYRLFLGDEQYMPPGYGRYDIFFL